MATNKKKAARATTAKKTAAGRASRPGGPGQVQPRSSKPGALGAAKVRARVAAKAPRKMTSAPRGAASLSAPPASLSASPRTATIRAGEPKHDAGANAASEKALAPVSSTSLAKSGGTSALSSPESKSLVSSGGRVLITGATGFLGAHLVRLLATHTDPRRVRTLQTTVPGWLERLGVENLRGSVTSPDDVKRALEGVTEVYHLAGMVSSKEDDAHKMYALHVDGTRVLGKAAIDAGVRRVVMASTSGTIAVSKHADPSLDETCGTPLEIISRWPYYASKAYQEETARRVLGDKVELVMVNPSLLLGPGDDRLSSTRVVLQFLAREILMTPPGGLNFVDVRDVAAILPVAMAKGRSGERYLLGAANWTFNELFGRLERMSKVSGPLMKGRGNVPFWLARAQASLYRHWGKTPPFEPASVEMATYFWYFDDRKAKDELGFAARDPADTLFDTMTYVRERFLEGFKGAVSGAADETSAKASSRARADHAEEEAFEHGMPS